MRTIAELQGVFAKVEAMALDGDWDGARTAILDASARTTALRDLCVTPRALSQLGDLQRCIAEAARGVAEHDADLVRRYLDVAPFHAARLQGSVEP